MYNLTIYYLRFIFQFNYLIICRTDSKSLNKQNSK